MTDHLSDVFRDNVEAIREQRGLNRYQFGRIVTPNDPTQYRIQIVRGGSLMLSTVCQWSERLGIDPLLMLTPDGVGRLERGHELSNPDR